MRRAKKSKIKSDINNKDKDFDRNALKAAEMRGKMTTRRDTDLQRLSRIENISSIDSTENGGEEVQQRGHPVAMMTIEAAIAVFLSEIYDTVDWCFLRGGYIGDFNGSEKRRITPEYRQELIDKLAKALEDDASARYQFSHYGMLKELERVLGGDIAVRTDGDGGFMLYSYDKYGEASVLSEYTPSGVGFAGEA